MRQNFEKYSKAVPIRCFSL